MGAPRIISLHSILGPPDHFLRLLYGAPKVSFFSYNMGAPLRSLSLFTIWGPLQISFFACYRGATSDFSFFTKYMGPSSAQFLRLLYGPPQVSFFAYYMGPLRLVSVHTFWVPLSDQFFLLLYGAPSDHFFAYYMGGPSDQFHRLLYEGPLRSVSSLTI